MKYKYKLKLLKWEKMLCSHSVEYSKMLKIKGNYAVKGHTSNLYKDKIGILLNNGLKKIKKYPNPNCDIIDFNIIFLL